MTQPLVSLRGVSLTYHTPDRETSVLDNMNFEVGKGELFGIVGPSGCGKTTVLSLISGILKPSGGEVLTDGKQPDKCDISGYMLQKDELLPWRNILSNVLLGAELKKMDMSKAKERAKELLNKYNLGDTAEYYPSQLSGGMRQRVALIRTLVLSPQILLLDEPFSALDFQTRLQVVDDVYSVLHSEGITAIFVTHDINEAISMCDRVAVLSSKPCTIKKIINIEMDNLTPTQRRKEEKFVHLYDEILRNLQTEKE
ncbi:MAG: ABC transporter ATP-binding protein [Clostridia bacterium]|nr:ABC transporter ATP-binding protein [Clostridia bacterium]